MKGLLGLRKRQKERKRMHNSVTKRVRFKCGVIFAKGQMVNILGFVSVADLCTSTEWGCFAQRSAPGWCGSFVEHQP